MKPKAARNTPVVCVSKETGRICKLLIQKAKTSQGLWGLHEGNLEVPFLAKVKNLECR